MSSKTHPNSRIVTIFRAGSILSRAQGPAIDDFFSSSKQSIGSYFDSTQSQKVGSGLSFAEEKILLPNIIDTPADDKEFRKKLTEFYTDLTTAVPHGTGVQLETGLEESNDKPVSEKNMPLDLMAYIRYRHALRHPWVAGSREAAAGNQMKHYYIFDKTNVQNKNTRKVKELDAAMQIYLKIKSDINVVDQMLTLLGVEPREFTGKDADDLKVEKLRTLAEKDPEKFQTTYESEHLEVRYWIKTMISTKVLKEVGTRIVDPESEGLLGNNLEETIWYFRDDQNSEHVVTLKARMQEALAAAPLRQAGSRKTILNK